MVGTIKVTRRRPIPLSRRLSSCTVTAESGATEVELIENNGNGDVAKLVAKFEDNRPLKGPTNATANTNARPSAARRALAPVPLRRPSTEPIRKGANLVDNIRDIYVTTGGTTEEVLKCARSFKPVPFGDASRRPSRSPHREKKEDLAGKKSSHTQSHYQVALNTVSSDDEEGESFLCSETDYSHNEEDSFTCSETEFSHEDSLSLGSFVTATTKDDDESTNKKLECDRRHCTDSFDNSTIESGYTVRMGCRRKLSFSGIGTLRRQQIYSETLWEEEEDDEEEDEDDASEAQSNFEDESAFVTIYPGTAGKIRLEEWRQGSKATFLLSFSEDASERKLQRQLVGARDQAYAIMPLDTFDDEESYKLSRYVVPFCGLFFWG